MNPPRALYTFQSQKKTPLDTAKQLVPFADEGFSIEQTVRQHWGVPETDKERKLRRFETAHLALKDPPPSVYGPGYDFADVFEYNNPWPDNPSPRQTHRPRLRQPSPPERPFWDRRSSEDDEILKRWNAMDGLANSTTPLISQNESPELEAESENSPATVVGKDYGAFEPRLAYRVMLGGRTHFHLYSKGTYWPFPIEKALRAMEDRLMDSLNIEPGARILLDAGCGEGYVAMHLVQRRRMRVHRIEVIDRQVLGTPRDIMDRRFEESVMVEELDYYNLDRLGKDTFDNVFTMESLCHPFEPERVFAEFFRVLKPSGKLVLHELAWSDAMLSPGGFDASAEMSTSLNHVPVFEEIKLKEMVKKQGFRDVVVEDISAHIMPLLHLFSVMAYIPSLFIRHCGLQRFFANQASSIIIYKGMKLGYLKYLLIKGRKTNSNDIIVHHSKLIPFSRKPKPKPEDRSWPFKANPGDPVRSGISPPQQSSYVVLPAEEGSIPLSLAGQSARFASETRGCHS